MNKALKEKKINILHAWVSLRKMANICQETELQINTVDSLYVFFFPPGCLATKPSSQPAPRSLLSPVGGSECSAL